MYPASIAFTLINICPGLMVSALLLIMWRADRAR
jgi:hypothetical protein